MSRKRKVIFLLLIVLAALAAGYVVYYVTLQRVQASKVDDLRDQFVTQEPVEQVVEPEPEPVVSEPEEEEPEPEPERVFVSPIDFVSLQEINPDVYAWLEIPGMDISYPVVQHAWDIDYYLRRAYDGTSSTAGSIFSEPGRAK
ncbi:MAG: class B sortase, partial [Oscillospiraceae bacterium]|nr:class B sortase [Oscillospiraceae bacterium]